MDHKRAVEWRRDYYNMLKDVGVSIESIEAVGDIEERIQAEKLLEDSEGIAVEWLGPCKEEEFGKGTLDVRLKVKSLSGMQMPYKITTKLYEVNGQDESNKENTYRLENKNIKHDCDESQFRFITRLPGPCHHILAATKFLEDGFIKYCKEVRGIEVIDIEPKYHKKIPKDVIKLYDDLKRDSRIDAIDRKRILYKYTQKRHNKVSD